MSLSNFKPKYDLFLNLPKIVLVPKPILATTILTTFVAFQKSYVIMCELFVSKLYFESLTIAWYVLLLNWPWSPSCPKLTLKGSKSFIFFWPFSGFIDRIAEECDRKEGKRGGVTRGKGTQAGSRTWVCCRASAHGLRTLPTELSSAPRPSYFDVGHQQQWKSAKTKPCKRKTSCAFFNMKTFFKCFVFTESGTIKSNTSMPSVVTHHMHGMLLSMTAFYPFHLHPLLGFFFFFLSGTFSGTQTQTTSPKGEAMKKYTPIMGH